MRSFQQDLEKFTARGVYVLAVSVDPPETTERLREKQGYTFPILCDTKLEVIRNWDLVHPHGGIKGADIARPAEFLIDPGGIVRWRNLTDDYRVRLHAPAALKMLDQLHVGTNQPGS